MRRTLDHGVGVDVGGTGIKGGPVDLAAGQLVGQRVRIPTPHPATRRARWPRS